MYVPANGDRAAQTHLVAPGGEGPSWTISRAELAAIWAALTVGHTTICTDSLASIWMIQAAVCDPMRLRRHKHRPLLEAIVALIDAAPTQVTIAKVAAHQGVGAMGAIGNNEADAAAKEAARDDEACDVRCEVEAHGFSSQVWIKARTERRDGTVRLEHVGNLRSDLTKQMLSTHRLGSADPTQSLYATLWRETARTALPGPSNSFASDPQVTHVQRRTVWAYRTGTLFNRKLEQRWFKTGDGLCPLCKQQDGGGHIAGGCLDPRMRGMYTARHNSRSQQQANAEKQHEQLEALLVTRLNGKGTVERKTILVGHSGTIYYDLSLETLMSLGVPRSCALKALGKAHRLACQHLHSIVGVRRHLEPPRPKGRHRQGMRPP